MNLFKTIRYAGLVIFTHLAVKKCYWLQQEQFTLEEVKDNRMSIAAKVRIILLLAAGFFVITFCVWLVCTLVTIAENI